MRDPHHTATETDMEMAGVGITVEVTDVVDIGHHLGALGFTDHLEDPSQHAHW